MTCDDDEELALVDATGDGRSAETESNGTTDDDDDAIRGEGFLRFFDVGTGAGTGEVVDTGESASGD
jgi:hypothetical protein